MQLVISLPEKEFAIENGKDVYLVTSEAQKITLEHSLYTISKWEAKYHKSYFKNTNKTEEEMAYYVRCMIVKPEFDSPEAVDNLLISRLLNENPYNERIYNYLNDRMSATYFREDPNETKNNEIVTSELLYFFMIKLEMPVEIFEHWHINRLNVLFEVFARKDNTSKKKRSSRSIMQDNRALNEMRKKQLNTRG